MKGNLSIPTSNFSTSGKPFLRWAGGKSWLLKYIHQFMPKDGFGSYHEPFLGGASMFFHLQPEFAFLSDLNIELIDTYLSIRDELSEVLFELNKFENSKEFYYHIRNQDFSLSAQRAAKFIYLNQTSFNGIYRVNLKGVYNVPYGYRTKQFCDIQQLTKASLSLQGKEIFQSDFFSTIENVGANDLVFLDPPYTVTHNNNGFIKYNKKLFDLESQLELARYIDEISNKGAFYILTNAAHHDIRKIFSKKNNAIHELSRVSLVGGKKAKRGSYEEFLITNIL